ARLPAMCGSNGTRLTGSKKTNKSSATRATLTCESTRCAHIGTSRWRSTALYSPRRAAPYYFSKPDCQRGTTSTAQTSRDRLDTSDTQSVCPYKGITSGYWSARIGDTVHADIAWTYDYPMRQVAPITGLIAFYNEKLDIVLDGHKLPRPQTHFV